MINDNYIARLIREFDSLRDDQNAQGKFTKTWETYILLKLFKKAYEKGARDALEATKLSQGRKKYIDTPYPIHYGSTFNPAIKHQENRIESILESLKDNSASEIPTDSSD